jgi:hypothetical protein
MGQTLDLYRRAGEHSTYHIATHKTPDGYYGKAYRLDNKWNGTTYAPTSRETLLGGKHYSSNDRKQVIRQIKEDAGLNGIKTDIYSY